MDAITTTSPITLAEAMEFAWLEADLLDSASYDEWLALWTADARYVVPIDPAAEDFENTLNLAYDDAAMRQKRVDRIRNGQSVSATPVARTIRLMTRFRMLHAEGSMCMMRCAQLLTEYRRGRERTYAADLTYRLVRGPAGLRIEQKVVRLINAEDSLTGISYIL
jgi:3-phenylpropionate/cinnamic acid dioxygenase small subunit